MAYVELPGLGRALRRGQVAPRPVRRVLMTALVIIAGLGVVAIRTAIIRRRTEGPDAPGATKPTSLV
ncbi:MAG: hypothetical protein QOD88_3077 [Mycobacterium sp.]|nr:hypothetical protein [Mycobacterium sp.]